MMSATPMRKLRREILNMPGSPTRVPKQAPMIGYVRGEMSMAATTKAALSEMMPMEEIIAAIQQSAMKSKVRWISRSMFW